MAQANKWPLLSPRWFKPPDFDAISGENYGHGITAFAGTLTSVRTSIIHARKRAARFLSDILKTKKIGGPARLLVSRPKPDLFSG